MSQNERLPLRLILFEKKGYRDEFIFNDLEEKVRQKLENDIPQYGFLIREIKEEESSIKQIAHFRSTHADFVAFYKITRLSNGQNINRVEITKKDEDHESYTYQSTTIEEHEGQRHKRFEKRTETPEEDPSLSLRMCIPFFRDFLTTTVDRQSTVEDYFKQMRLFQGNENIHLFWPGK